MTLPHDLPIEQAVLGAMLMDKSAVESGIDLIKEDSDVFFDDRHKAIYASLYRLFQLSSETTVLMVKADLEGKGLLSAVGGAAYLVQALSGQYVTSANIKEHCKVLLDLKAKRDIVKLGVESAEKASTEPADKAIEFVQIGVETISERRRGSLGKGPRHVLPIYMEAYKTSALSSGALGLVGVDTGHEKLNDATGGWRAGHQIITGGSTSQGKTALVVDFVKHAVRRNIGVLFFSLEMSAAELVNRLAANVLSIDSRNIDRGQLSDDEWSQYSEFRAEVKKWPLMIDDEPGLTATEIRARTRKAAREFPKKLGVDLRMVAVDYLQIMGMSDVPDKNPSRERQIAYASGHLRATWKTQGVAGHVISQVSRGDNRQPNKEPQLPDLRDSGSVEQDADVVLMLWYPERDPENPKYPDDERMVLQIKKQRGGQRGLDFPMTFRKKYSRFESESLPSFSAMPAAGLPNHYEPQENR